MHVCMFVCVCWSVHVHVRQGLFVHYFTSGFSYTDFMYSIYIYIYIYMLHAVSHKTQHKLVVQGPLLLGWEILGS